MLGKISIDNTQLALKLLHAMLYNDLQFTVVSL